MKQVMRFDIEERNVKGKMDRIEAPCVGVRRECSLAALDGSLYDDFGHEEEEASEGKLKKEECCGECRKRLRQAVSGTEVLPDGWQSRANVLGETAQRLSSGQKKKDKDTWFWKEEVKKICSNAEVSKEKVG